MTTSKYATAFMALILLAAGCAQAPRNPVDNTSLDSNASPATATETADIATDRLAIIEEIMKESGTDAMIEQVPAMVAMGFDQQQPPPLDRDDYEKFRKTFIAAFDPPRIRQTIVMHLQENYDTERYAAFLTQLKSPLGRKMTALETAAHTPQAQQEMMRMGNIIMGQASPERLKLVRRLDEAAGATDGNLHMQMLMTETMIRNLNRIMPAPKRLSDPQMNQMLEQIRMQSIFPIRQVTHLSMVYTFRSIDDTELQEYIQLYESDTGRWGTKLLRGAWERVSADIALELAQRIEQTFIEKNAL